MDQASQQSISGKAIRRIVLEQSKRAHVGHIGSALCVADLLAALYGGILNVPEPGIEDPDRDRFVLSKGHASLALYAAFHLRGWISTEQLDTYCGDDSLLGVHPDHLLHGVDFSTGSLGQGLSLATGAALAARLQQSARRSFVLISDAECNEGSTWEAAMFAAHHQLDNFVAVIDLNGQQALNHTEQVLDLSPMAERWSAFGWETIDIDGHDNAAIREACTAPPAGKPRLVIARTTFGKGVSYMERKVKWHYWPMSDEEYAQAMQELDD